MSRLVAAFGLMLCCYAAAGVLLLMTRHFAIPLAWLAAAISSILFFYAENRIGSPRGVYVLRLIADVCLAVCLALFVGLMTTIAMIATPFAIPLGLGALRLAYIQFVVAGRFVDLLRAGPPVGDDVRHRSERHCVTRLLESRAPALAWKAALRSR